MKSLNLVERLGGVGKWWKVPLILIGGFLCAASWAQDQPCEQEFEKKDETCTGGHDCLSTTGCASESFTAACSGYYDLIASVECEGGGDCADFNACVNIYDGEGNRVPPNCHINPCSGCITECTSANVCLVANKQYTLYVCLVPCDPSGNCPSPMPNCYAVGKVYYDGTPAICQ